MELDRSIERVTSYFKGHIEKIPVVSSFDEFHSGTDALLDLGLCRYKRGEILIADALPPGYTRDYVLDHEMLHWMERDMGLISDEDSYPHHFLHMIYHGQDEKDRVMRYSGNLDRLKKTTLPWIYDKVKCMEKSVDCIDMMESFLADTFDPRLIHEMDAMATVWEAHNSVVAAYLSERLDKDEAIPFLKEASVAEIKGFRSYQGLLESF